MSSTTPSMTEQEYQHRRRELEQLIDDASRRLAAADLRLVALREERVRLLVRHAREHAAVPGAAAA